MKAGRVAIVYDRVNKWGGAERVLLALHALYPNATLFTSVYDTKSAPWAKVFLEIRTSFLQNIPLAKSNHEFFASLMPVAFESFDFTGYDLVISVTSEAAKGIITHGNTYHVNYCLTPTRYLWSGYNDYFDNNLVKKIGNPFVSYLKRWDKIAAHKPDRMIAISNVVKKRISEYYDRNVEVIFPPVETNKFVSENKKKKKYFLLVSRLVKYKRVDLAIRAFNKLGIPLIIVGTGREMKKLKKLSKNNIKFVGNVSDQELANYYSIAKALVFPQEEDFGIVAVEAQSAGVPVVAFGMGGALDTVVEGKTGVFFEKQTEDSLINAIKLINKTKFKTENIIKNAQRFSKERFLKEFATMLTR